MNPRVWLFSASILTLIHALLHTAGGLLGGPRNAAQAAARTAVQALHFDAFGSKRSYWDFYFGFGLATSVALFLSAALLWQLASLAKTDAAKARPFLAMLFIAFVALSVISWRYFFMPPLVLEIAIAVCIGAAFLSAGSKNSV